MGTEGVRPAGRGGPRRVLHVSQAAETGGRPSSSRTMSAASWRPAGGSPWPVPGGCWRRRCTGRAPRARLAGGPAALSRRLPGGPLAAPALDGSSLTWCTCTAPRRAWSAGWCCAVGADRLHPTRMVLAGGAGTGTATRPPLGAPGARWSVVCCVSEAEQRDGCGGAPWPVAGHPQRHGRRGTPGLRPCRPGGGQGVLGILPRPCSWCAAPGSRRRRGRTCCSTPGATSPVGAAGRLCWWATDRTRTDPRRADGLTGVTMMGACSRSETLAWMSASDVVACPSRYEGSPSCRWRPERSAAGRGHRRRGGPRGRLGAGREIVPMDEAEALRPPHRRPGRRGGASAGREAARSRADELAAQPRGRTRLLQLYDELVRRA